MGKTEWETYFHYKPSEVSPVDMTEMNVVDNSEVALANILDSQGYCVYFVVANYIQRNNHLNSFTLNGNVIRKTIPINNTRQREDGPVNNWESENITSKRPDYINLVRHRAKYFYQDLKSHSTYNLLRRKRFSLGIAEVGHLPSGFAIFYELRIRNTIAISATPARPPFYHFLGLPIPVEVPEYYTAQPGDGFADSQIRLIGSQRLNENIEELGNIINNYQQIYGDEFFQQNSLPPLWQIFANVRYFLINHPQIVAYPRHINNKIGFIGGIAIDQENLEMFRSKVLNTGAIEPVLDDEYSFLNDSNCIAVVSFGTTISFFGLSQNQLVSIFNAFRQHQNCNFVFRADAFIRNYVNNNVELPDNALFAGVPVVCLPFSGDQRYNASVVEYLRLGMWVRAPNLENEFQNAVNALLDEERGFLATAQQIAWRLHTEYSAEQNFLNAVQNAINFNVPFDRSIQLGAIQFVHQ
uniref:glucuronosyltransferase n=1 Tax=Meloidogyne floridensis TaxID=298350 RepID=A0A915NVF8_9BILA